MKMLTERVNKGKYFSLYLPSFLIIPPPSKKIISSTICFGASKSNVGVKDRLGYMNVTHRTIQTRKQGWKLKSGYLSLNNKHTFLLTCVRLG